MSDKKMIFTGTLILTLSGFLSRILGFYNRIFLSNLIGARELGIYHLIFPVYLLCFTLVCHGFETGISNMTSRFYAIHQRNNAHRLLRLACLCALMLSFCLSFSLYKSSGYLGKYLLTEASTAKSLRIASLALPFVAVKSCIHGYYIGRNKSGVSAASQLIEQISRVGSIYLLSVSVYAFSADASLAVWGMVIGEIISTIYTVLAYLFTTRLHPLIMNWSGRNDYHLSAVHEMMLPSRRILGEFFRFSIPLTINHVSVTAVNSLETMLIPFVLTFFYGSQEKALEIYGTLTGMALPFLFFPATITNSLAVMLLPAISSSYKQKEMAQIKYTISKSLHYCIVIGIFSSFAFLIYGNALGETIFHSSQAGHFVYLFAILCPFMYVAQTISSILNGFGRTKSTLYHNLLGVGIRIFFILCMIPIFGIRGYLYGLLTGYSVQILLDLIALIKITSFPFSVEKTLLLPAALALLGGWVSERLYLWLSGQFSFPPVYILAIAGIFYCLLFTVSQLFFEHLTC